MVSQHTERAPERRQARERDLLLVNYERLIMPEQQASPPRLSRVQPVMRVVSTEEEGGAYATLNGQNQMVDIKIAANPGSVMAMKRNSEMRNHQPAYTYDEASEVRK